MHDADAEKGILGMLQESQGQRHLLALQDYPDPDAMASASAQQQLSRSFDVEAVVVFAGEVSHHQNRRLAELLGLQLHHLRDGFPLEGFDGAVFIDNQGTTCPYLVRTLARAHIPTLMVVDHHEGESSLEPQVRVTEAVGATATLYAELLQGKLELLDLTSAEGRLLASGLLYGILTDTQQLATATPRDRRAVSWLTPYSDQALIRDVAGQPVPWETMEVIGRARTTQVTRRGFRFAGVGYMPARHRDALPQAATWLLGQGGAHTSVVFGIIRDWRLQETITGSLRTILPSPTPHEFLQEALGEEADGQVMSGGRAFAGGFEIPVGMSSRASPMEYQMVRWAYYEHLLLQRLLGAADTTSLHEPATATHPGGALGQGSPYPDLFDRLSPVWKVIDPDGGDGAG
ncbi:MAG TPA: hypothetical protein VFI11_13125 [Anaerolineales bacterium]|nr:hypothetical protein [Anaerolineales bacterium]